MVDSLIERDTDEAFRASWASLYNKLSKLHKRRHQVAHFTIIQNVIDRKPYLHPFFTMSRAGQTKPLSSNDLSIRAASFRRAAERVRNLCLYALHRLGKLGASDLQGRDPARLLRSPSAPSYEGTPPLDPPSEG